MGRSLKVGNLTISDESEAFVIAEIGHNHQGNVELCEKFFHAAADAPISDSSGQPDYGDKRVEIGGSDPGAMPGGSTSLRSLRELRLGKPGA